MLLDFAGVLVEFALDLADEEVGGFFETAIVVWGSDFGSKRSLRSVAVAEVHADVELRAARIESAAACADVILLEKH